MLEATHMAGKQAAGMQEAGMEAAGLTLVPGVGMFDMVAAVATMPDATAAMSLAVDVLGDKLFHEFAIPLLLLSGTTKLIHNFALAARCESQAPYCRPSCSVMAI